MVKITKYTSKLIYLSATLILLAGCGASVGSSQDPSNGSSDNNSSSEPIGETPSFGENPPVSGTPPAPTPTPAPITGSPPQGPVTDFKLGCEEARFIYLINLYRRSSGVGALSVSKSAVMSSQWHADNMASLRYFSHTEPSGRNFVERAASFGYAAYGENIASGNNSAAGTFCQWRNSPGHNQNMLSRSYISTGIGMYKGGPLGHYWSSNFGLAVTDAIAEPLTLDENCPMPTAVMTCS